MTRFEVCDAKDLSQFSNRSFDLVIFFGAGIDAVGHQHRIKMLGEIHRVLSANGAFAFSSHNLKSTLKKPWHPTKLPWKINPLLHPRGFARATARFALETVNHLRNRVNEERHEGYALLNDEADHFGFVLYYITVEKQIKQLIKSGFCSVVPVDLKGDSLSPEDSVNCGNTWVHYLCRRPDDNNQTTVG